MSFPIRSSTFRKLRSNEVDHLIDFCGVCHDGGFDTAVVEVYCVYISIETIKTYDLQHFIVIVWNPTFYVATLRKQQQ